MNQIFKELISGRYNGKAIKDCDEAEQRLVILGYMMLTGCLLEIIAKTTKSMIDNVKAVIECDFDAPKQESTDGEAD